MACASAGLSLDVFLAACEPHALVDFAMDPLALDEPARVGAVSVICRVRVGVVRDDLPRYAPPAVSLFGP